ncbi:MAG: hypothetical protein ABI193_00150, partial [Minicystis sp.]
MNATLSTLASLLLSLAVLGGCTNPPPTTLNINTTGGGEGGNGTGGGTGVGGGTGGSTGDGNETPTAKQFYIAVIDP